MKLFSLSPFVSLVLTPLLVIAPLWGQTPAAPPDSTAGSTLVQGLQLRLLESDGPQSVISSKAVKGFTVEVKDSAGNAVSDAAVAFRLPDTGASGTFGDGTHSAVSYTDSLGRAHVNGLQWSATPGTVSIRVTATKGTAHAGILIDQALASASAAAKPVAAASLALPVGQPTSPAPAPTAAQPLPPALAAPAAAVLVSNAGPPPQQPGTLAKPSGALAPLPAPEPAVSVTGGSPQASSHSSKTKWIILAVVAVGAAAGAGLAMKGKSSGSASAASGISIGNPTISVGH